MRTILTIAALAVTLAMPAAASADIYHHYECTDGSSFEVAFVSETKAAYLQIDGKSLVLPKRFSLISQRFKQGGYSFAMRGGGKAIMKHGGKTSQCEAK
jgi:membrane-bound inhibitor of C-type lysozyme